MSDIGQSAGRVARSPAFKFFLISFLVLLLLIPLLMVIALVSDREGRSRSVMSDIARTWGGVQTLTGPYLVVPYSVRVETRDGDKIVQQTQERRAVFLPEELTITGNGKSNVLTRSIFDVNVYTASLRIEGRFSAPDVADVDPNAISIRWKDAIFALALSDVAGLKEAATLKVNDRETLPFAPSLGIPGNYLSGIHAKLDDAASVIEGESAAKAFSFHADLVFTGSSSLSFTPAARETRVELSSDWPHPSFMGAFLPVEREVGQSGFSAKWRVPHLARSVPNQWTTTDGGVDRFLQYQFGVTFYQPVDFYGLVNRAVKYGLLFLAVGFMGVFVLELMSHKRVHAVQYLFVGLAMVFFYVLLLSLAEHLGFTAAYLIASLATGGMLSIYVGKSLESGRSGLIMAALFALLYGLLYLILRLEDYALLAGAALGFAALTAVMFTTLKVDWSGLGTIGARPINASKGRDDEMV
ncbi:cell envelope integrity protein CreD [Hyphomicrobium sp. DMF-1]|jgi:inner membrane protein|uniref:cell envelope integrity protein CreD n=1 Tax=Hyphomicrobium sp. DMF-1 TaxID=3019544 RepID=UPI0022EBD375|nr:cell envelope integrity protein CreD [Hyphomicrobium sp. DMF-1]WBT37382.1 cell envelope integrity protein CreD [Hyphomicrobium sp. DMF-1]